MNKLSKKYLAKLNDFAHITPTQAKFVELQRMETDILNAYKEGKIPEGEKRVFLSMWGILMDQMRSELHLPANKDKDDEMLAWAQKEIELAIQAEKAASQGSEEWRYGAGCFESALRAYRTLLEDEHSGMSVMITKSVFNRLVDGKVLTPIEDESDIWQRVSRDNGITSYQCTRMGSLFKRVAKDKSVTYTDVERVKCYDIHNPKISFTNGLATKLVDDLIPITMPYLPANKPYRVFIEDVDDKTRGHLYLSTPEGKRIDLNLYYTAGEDGKLVGISKEKFEELKAAKNEEKQYDQERNS